MKKLKVTDKTVFEKVRLGKVVHMKKDSLHIYLNKDNYFEVIGSLGEAVKEKWELVE